MLTNFTFQLKIQQIFFEKILKTRIPEVTDTLPKLWILCPMWEKILKSF